MTQILTPAKWEASYLPRYPFATDDLAYGIRRESRSVGLTRRYIETSPKALLSMFVIDVDREDTLMEALSRPLPHPDPSWISINPTNGHGHVGYLLKTPVCRTDSARLKPMRYAACVQSGLTTALQGDFGYTGGITKSPLNNYWETYWGREEPYTLRELALGLGNLFPKSLPQRAIENSGLGRNVALFDSLRSWSYSAVSRYWGGGRQLWEETSLAYALNVNTEFVTPLSSAEVGHTARSVSVWTWRNITEEQTMKNRATWASTDKQTYRSKLASANRRFDRAAMVAADAS